MTVDGFGRARQPGTTPQRSPGAAPTGSFPYDETLSRGLSHLAATQHANGMWKGDYGGPQFLLPLYIGVAHILRIDLGDELAGEMRRYLRAHQNPDGSFGLHVEGHGHVFTSVLVYVAQRLLGVPSDDPDLVRCRRWFSGHGGPTASASWGKFILSLLGLYDWDGLDPVPPEAWLLPRSLPVHPGRLWCHCRMVYLPMAYLYGARYVAPETPVLRALRSELYDDPAYEDVDWRAARSRVSPTDAYTPRSWLLRRVNRVLDAYERRPSRALRRRAMAFCLDQIRQEDENTDYICIGPINKLLNALVWHVERPGGDEVRRHVARMPDYLWHATDGVKMQGYNSSELWDTAFALQAIAETGRVPECRAMVERAFAFVERTQVLEDTPEHEHYFRHASRGGWPFSTLSHGWPISDCTAEGLKAALALEPHLESPLPKWRLDAAVDLILSFQNEDGGWATYERTRGPRWLELLNPSDCFADIMIDYSYVECTSASVTALARYQARFPGERQEEIDRALRRGEAFLRGAQRADGSWEGSWGVCFTYGTLFAVEGLRAAGASTDDPALRRAVRFLQAHQRPDGSWGETVDACAERRWVDAEDGQVVMTAWAVLALIGAGEARSDAVASGLRFLAARQRPDGSYPPERIAGVFNKTCAIHYDNYLKVFPVWAMGAARHALLTET